MSSIALPQYIEKLLTRVAQENSFIDYSVNIESGSQVGDGFSSALYSIVLKENNSERRLDLVCKEAPQNENFRKEFIADISFKREALFYETIMPRFIKFQDEKNVPEGKQFRSYPKCYATIADDDSQQYAIFLEDLRPQGFKMWNKAEPSPIENMCLTLRKLGEFHGLSIAMKDQYPVEFDEYKNIADIFRIGCQSKNVLNMYYNSYDSAINSLRSEEHKNIMRHIKDNLLAYMEDCLNPKSAEPFGVLNHGDCWNNNFLYLFNENNIAYDVRFLDWPIIRYVSPAIDLTLNIFTSTEKSLRDKEYENMLKTYYESLATIVDLLGSKSSELFTFQNLKDELKRFGNYALMLAPIILQVSLADSSEISKLDEMFDKAVKEDQGQVELITGLGEKGQRAYDRRINDVFEDIVNLGYYHKVD